MTNQPSLYRIPYANLGRLAACRALSGQEAQDLPHDLQHRLELLR
jgi:hypothetical protein